MKMFMRHIFGVGRLATFKRPFRIQTIYKFVTLLRCFMIVLVMATFLVGCSHKKGEASELGTPSLFELLPSVQPTSMPAIPIQSTRQQPVQPTAQPTVHPTATRFAFGPLFDETIDLMAGPVAVPIEIQIPALNVNAPIIGVGLTAELVMDAPKGLIRDPVWHTAFWYRGGGIPGESGTATIAGHVNDPLGRPEIFANLEELQPGDAIIIHYTLLNMDIRFVVDEVQNYSVEESSAPERFAKIFGDGPVSGKGPQPSADGRSHLTLITCAGNIVDGKFDHHTVVFATRQ